jgi:hypothetical protein
MQLIDGNLQSSTINSLEGIPAFSELSLLLENSLLQTSIYEYVR